MSDANNDLFELERFVAAQRGVYDDALRELRAGAKRSHWIWFIFPQVAGLGTSAMAERYAIQSAGEARAYLQHPVLGPRLTECGTALLGVADKSAREIMGTPDDLKLRSSMTLFATIAAKGSPFQAVLDRYFAGEKDGRTLEYLAAHR